MLSPHAGLVVSGRQAPGARCTAPSTGSTRGVAWRPGIPAVICISPPTATPREACDFSQVAFRTSWFPVPSSPPAAPRSLLNRTFRASLAPGKALGEISSRQTKALHLGSYPVPLGLNFPIGKMEVMLPTFRRLTKEPKKRAVYFVYSKTLILFIYYL